MSFRPQGSRGESSSFAMRFQSSDSQPSGQARTHGFERDGHSSPMLGFPNNPFDIFDWYPQFQSCLRYFLDHAQHSAPVQAMAAFMNIQLPCQKQPPIMSSRSGASPPSSIPPPMSRAAGKMASPTQPEGFVSLTPYIRRLIATGFDVPGVLHGFFGDDWAAGIGRIHEVERRNYLFAAKSENWLRVKSHYDMDDGQTVPFLRPLQNVTEEEIVSSESNWSEWLAMQDWMIGPRSILINNEVDRNSGMQNT